MYALWNALSALYLGRLNGWYWMQTHMSKLRRPIIPRKIYKYGKKLNLGSGKQLLPTYTNIDILEEFSPDIVCDVSKLTFASDNEYDLVRASHVLEHFTIDECKEILIEWRRVLTPNGYLIVCVPDFEVLSWRTILKPSGLNLDCETYKNGWINGIFALDLSPEYRHKIVFYFKSLNNLLSKSGFKVVGRLNYLREEPYILGIIDDSCSLFSLNVVAKKI